MKNLFIYPKHVGSFEFPDTDMTSSYQFNMSIQNGEMDVFHRKLSTSLKDYKNIFWFVRPVLDRIHVFSAVGCMTRKYGIHMIDNTFANTSGKLFQMFRFAEKDLPVPDTFYGSIEFLCEKLKEIGGTGVLKSTHSTKGQDNYLVKTPEEIEKILKENPETYYILQNFVPNDGDYRIVVVDFEPKMIIYRSANNNDHRNNTSLGGNAKIIPLEEADPELIRVASEAAKALDIRLAGVDIVTDKETGKHYLLEINRTPQLLSGAFVDEKVKMINDLIRS